MQGKKHINVMVLEKESWDASFRDVKASPGGVSKSNFWVWKHKLSAHLWPEVSRSANAKIHAFGGPRWTQMQNDPLESAVKASMFLEGRMGEELDTCPFATGCRRCTYVLGSINSHEISI